MNSMIKAATVASLVLLAGCTAGPTASFSQRMRDTLTATSASNVPASQVKCITLTQPFKYVTGSTFGPITFSLPPGNYKGSKKIRSGYFYYSPTPITTSSWDYESQSGIYINNQFNQAILFFNFPNEPSGSPIRGFILPNTIFSIIKKGGKC